MAKLNATDGSVGYSDIATARSNGLGITPTSVPASRDDDRFWTQTTNPVGTFVEPTAHPNGYQTNGPKGANCESVTFTGVPATTLGDWSNANGTDSTAGWVVCTLTYGLLFDDYKGPYSLQGAGDAAEEQKARTVKDYWASIVSDDGQEILFANDYSQLPVEHPQHRAQRRERGLLGQARHRPVPDRALLLPAAHRRHALPGLAGAGVQRVRVAQPHSTGRRWRSRRATRPCRAPAP